MNTNPLRLFCDTVPAARIERVETLFAADGPALLHVHADAELV